MPSEKELIQSASEKMRELLAKGDYLELFVSMKTLRQAYGLFYKYLQEKLKTDPSLKDFNNELLEDFFVSSIQYASLRPFDSILFLQTFKKHVVPNLTNLVNYLFHSSSTAAVEDEEENQENQNSLVEDKEMNYYPFTTWKLHVDDPGLPNDKPITLVGQEKLLKYLLKLLMWESYSNFHTLVHLRGPLTSLEDAPPSSRYIPVDYRDWRGCANSESSLITFLHNFVFDKINDRVDLIIIDDLSNCYTSKNSYENRPAAAKAGDANKVISSLCSRFYCPVVCCLPLSFPYDSEETLQPPDVNTLDYEQLKYFSYLTTVYKIKDKEYPDKKCNLVINNNFILSVWEDDICNVDFSFLTT
jgi:hypothetical protein